MGMVAAGITGVAAVGYTGLMVGGIKNAITDTSPTSGNGSGALGAMSLASGGVAAAASYHVGSHVNDGLKALELGRGHRDFLGMTRDIPDFALKSKGALIGTAAAIGVLALGAGVAGYFGAQF